MAMGQLASAMRQLRRVLGAPLGGDESDRQLLEQFASTKDEAAFDADVAGNVRSD